MWYTTAGDQWHPSVVDYGIASVEELVVHRLLWLQRPIFDLQCRLQFRQVKTGALFCCSTNVCWQAFF